MKINLLITPYRDAYFHHDYGSAVRDLQFIETLSRINEVHSITVINRPVSVLERLLLKKPTSKKIKMTKVATFDSTSKDIFGAIKGRSWANDVYHKVIEKHLDETKVEDCINVFLDFLPIGEFNPTKLQGWHYWYDFIDNFTKHNRFSKNEKALVKQKYRFVAQHSDLVSSVSPVCLESNGPYRAHNTTVVSNKVFEASELPTKENSATKQYDFGFIGFITDKFDIEFVKKIAKDHSVAIYGQVMDKKVGETLSSLSNVTTFGKFSYSEVPNICQQFKVGLLPYLAEKSHDGSPLKLYEYMKYNIPCLTSIDYEITDTRFIRNYNDSVDLLADISDMLKISGSESISQAIKEEWKLDFSLKNIISTLSEINRPK
ncbi:hypothetical protein [Litorilituus sediminis]|uniref:Glycosyltransferase n=1 Tax=Litorilituus sediminis TaxID=718192 RepID=A0A4P6P7B4_9GAMM|nr:hypothetical protein [Litorilituus sediminis]QBG35287.1 hypothetical protein EMK97_05920 [Litorilituus sediminis]